jgi:hypothetical protein
MEGREWKSAAGAGKTPLNGVFQKNHHDAESIMEETFF